MKIKVIKSKTKPAFWWLLPEAKRKTGRLAQLNKHNHRATKIRRKLAETYNSNEV